jgi:hypothetical protein
MVTIKKILLAGACAGLLALSAAPVMAAGPMVSGARDQMINSGGVQNIEYRYNQWQGRWTWYGPPRPYYQAPGNSQWGRSHAPWYSNGNWGNHRYNPPNHGRYYDHHRSYWHR